VYAYVHILAGAGGEAEVPLEPVSVYDGVELV